MTEQQLKEWRHRQGIARSISNEFTVSVSASTLDFLGYLVQEYVTEPEARAVAALLHQMRNEGKVERE